MSAAPAEHVGRVYRERQQRYAERLRQGQRVRAVLTNEMDVVFRDVVKPGTEPVVGNLIIAAARTMTQRVGRVPRVDVQPEDDTDDSQVEAAEKHEGELNDLSLKMNVPATRLQAANWLVVHDLAPLVVRPSVEYGHPIIEARDPLTCLPGTVWPHKPDTVDVLFANRMSAWQARSVWPVVGRIVDAADEQVDNVIVGEYFDGTGITVCLLEPRVVVLEFLPNPCPGRPLCIMGRGFSNDLGFHGQFDHVVGTLIAQAKLFALMMAYADQQVAAETVVTGEIVSNSGRWATGPGAVNQIAAMPGASASKLINQMSPQVFTELDRLERSLRMGGGFPAQLSGEPAATIATGKGLEQLTLTVDDTVAYWQSVLDDAFMRAYGLVPPLARAMGYRGARNFTDKAKVYVRSLSGADPAETVRLLQMQGAKNLSRETIMGRLPEVDSPRKEMVRLDIDDLRQTALKGIEAGVVNGQMDAIQVAKIIQERKAGKEIEDVLVESERIRQEAAQEAQAQAAQAGGQAQQGPPGLSQLLSPLLMAEQSRRQALAAARTGPESQVAAQGQAAALNPPQGQAGIPGGAGVPA